MTITQAFIDKLPPWSTTLCIFLASVVAFIGLASAKRFAGDTTWAKSRNRTFGTFTEYLGAFVTAMLMTFVIGDWLAIASRRLEQADYAYAQRVETTCAVALFFTIFFVSVCLNKITSLRLILALIASAALAGCLVIILNAK
jgi:hypothetical protein